VSSTLEVCSYGFPIEMPPKRHASAKIQIDRTSGAPLSFSSREVSRAPWTLLFSAQHSGALSKPRESDFAQPTFPPSPTQTSYMSDKKSKKSPKPSQKYIHLGIPINIAVGPLGFRAELDTDPRGNRDRSYRDSEL